jgi:hypothetical protein
VKCKLLYPRLPIDRAEWNSRPSKTTQLQFPASWKDDKCFIAALVGLDIRVLAIINSRTARALARIEAICQFEFHVYATHLEVQKALSSKSSKARMFNASIEIYTPKSKYDEVGTLLSNRSLHLQDPATNLLRLPYINPQMLVFSGLTDNDIRRAEDSLLLTGDDQDTRPLSWSSVLGRLTYSSAESINISTVRLKTELLECVRPLVSVASAADHGASRHQLEALNFMLRREVGNIEQILCFWRPECTDDGTILSVFRYAQSHRMMADTMI